MKIACVVFAIAFLPTAAFSACGEKGGPGYRGPNGKCVSWAQIGRVCGTPPETRCSPEMTNKDSAAQDGAKIQSLMEDAHREKR